MRKMVMFVVMIMIATPVNAQTFESKRHFDSNNRYTGKSECSNGKCRFYDSNNKNIGRSEKDSFGNTRYYDENNKLIGTDKAR